MRRAYFLFLSAGAVASALPLTGCRQSRPQTESTETGITTTETRAEAAPGKPQPASPTIVRQEEVAAGVKQDNGLTIPKGFRIQAFATGLKQPRRLIIAPGATPQKYDVFVTEPQENRVRVLRETNGDGKADSTSVFTGETDQPYGLAFHPAGWLYVANTSEIIRFPYKTGQSVSNARPQFIAKLTGGGYNQHWTRNLLFSPDAKKLYVTVGSECNTCEEKDPQRAAISILNPDGSGKRLFSRGLRNPVGITWRPGTTELWTAVNERDNLGDDVPPDYITSVTDGSFHGWPYAYTDINGKVQPDPNFGSNSTMVRATVPARVPVQAHSAALGLVFYSATGKGAFPAEFQGDAFVTFHGSWNRSEKTGYKVVRVDFQNGKPTKITDFVRGYLRNERAWGRPVDIQMAPDGSLLFSDDGSGTIWRVSYTGKA